MNFLNFGYYVIEPASTPECMGLKCKQIVTATDCICEIHPPLDACFFINHKKRQIEYKKFLGLSDEEFQGLKEAVSP